MILNRLDLFSLSMIKVSKGQIKPKADWCAVDSPKKPTKDFFSLFCFSQQKNQIRSFIFWENLRRTNLLLSVLSDLCILGFFYLNSIIWTLHSLFICTFISLWNFSFFVSKKMVVGKSAKRNWHKNISQIFSWTIDLKN